MKSYSAHRSRKIDCKRGRTCKLIKAKVDRENICKIGTLDATDLEEQVFLTFM